MEERERLRHVHRERVFDLGLVRMNNESSNVYENNIFENYFSASAVAQVEALLADERAEVANQDGEVGEESYAMNGLNESFASSGLSRGSIIEPESPLRDLVSQVEDRFR